MPEISRETRVVPMCVLCGRNPASTGQGDHIPPRSLYTKAERMAATYQYFTVPACVECNGKGSSHDEMLKLMLGLVSGDTRANPEDVIDSMAATIGKNQRLANRIFSTMHYREEDGAVAVTFDEAAYKAVFSRMARGMYWHVTHTILCTTARLDVADGLSLGEDVMQELRNLPEAFPTVAVNGGTLKCSIFTANGADIMLLTLFDKMDAVVVIYGAKNHGP